MDAGGRFTVDPSELRALGRSMVVLSGRLAEARGVAQSSRDAFGDDRLAQAVGDFVERWRWQSDRIGERLSEASDRLRAAADNYQQVEDTTLRSEGR